MIITSNAHDDRTCVAEIIEMDAPGFVFDPNSVISSNFLCNGQLVCVVTYFSSNGSEAKKKSVRKTEVKKSVMIDPRCNLM